MMGLGFNLLRRFTVNGKKSKVMISLGITLSIMGSMFITYAAGDTNVPKAKFEISNVVPALNQVVTFDASASSDAEGAIVSYEWDFGDGTTATGVTVTHSFTEMDDYKVLLTVKDAAGNVDTNKKRVFLGRPEGWTEKTHSKSANPNYDLLFPDDQVLRMDINMKSTDYQTVKNEVSSFNMNSTKELTYVPVTIEYNGLKWWNVGFRCKGNSSLSNSKNSFKLPFRLNFDKFEDQNPEIDDQHFYGFSCMTFSNCWNDNSLMKEKLTSEIFLDGGVPAAKTSFCRVYVDTGNGPKYWGLYNMTEDASDAMLKEQFGDDSGNCYKPEGNGADWSSPFNQSAFVKKNNEEAADWSDVSQAHTALHASKNDAAAWRKNLDKYFNTTRFLRWLAINTSVVNWDCYGAMAHNYYLYNDVSTDGRLVWITWDHGLSMSASIFGGGGFGGGAFGGGAFGGMGGNTTLSLNEVTSKWPLIRNLLDDPEYKNVYHYEMKQAMDNGCMNPTKIETKVRAYQALIKPYVVGAEGETSDATMLSGGESAFNKACDDIISHIKTRQTEVNNYLNTVSISATPTPVATPTPSSGSVLIGDVNNDNNVNSTDYSLLRRYILGITTELPDPKSNIAADVDKNGKINSTDYTLLRRYILGIVNNL